LKGWGLDGFADAAELVLSELITNAIRHACTPRDRLIETRYERLPDGGLRIEVHDAGDGVPLMQRPSGDDESGRGLALVDAPDEIDARDDVAPLVVAADLQRAAVHAAQHEEASRHNTARDACTPEPQDLDTCIVSD